MMLFLLLLIVLLLGLKGLSTRGLFCYKRYLLPLYRVPHNFFSEGNIANWLSSNLSRQSHWATCFGYMIWFSWKCRNTLDFDGLDETSQLSSKVIAATEAYRSAAQRRFLSHSLQVTPTPQQRGKASWMLPPSDHLSLCVDAAVNIATGVVAGGGIFRNDMGYFKGAFAFSCGNCPVIRAELWAILQGLTHASNLGFRRLHIHSDSMLAVSVINSQASTHPHLDLVHKCRALLAELEVSSKLMHTPRGGNWVADAIARYALSSNISPTFFNVQPSFISCLLISDLVTASMEANSLSS